MYSIIPEVFCKYTGINIGMEVIWKTNTKKQGRYTKLTIIFERHHAD